MSKLVEINHPAPDFSLVDMNGNQFNLKEFNQNANVLLVFNRGFT
jgi:peroxiredoxin